VYSKSNFFILAVKEIRLYFYFYKDPERSTLSIGGKYFYLSDFEVNLKIFCKTLLKLKIRLLGLVPRNSVTGAAGFLESCRLKVHIKN
jgi:hypothetical protein